MNLEEIQVALRTGIPEARVEVVLNGSPCAQHSLLIDSAHALAVSRFLRYRPEFRLDFCSNVTAVDWPDRETSEKVKIKKLVDGVEKEVEETKRTKIPGYLEVIYHLFSMEKKTGPLVLRVRTANRTNNVKLQSLTSIWRSAEFQEREAFDLFGIVFEGHPDLRRLLMWEGFSDYPMRKDYVPPPDEEPDVASMRDQGACG